MEILMARLVYTYILQAVSLHFNHFLLFNFVGLFVLTMFMQVVREIEIYASRTGSSDNPIGQWAWALQHGYTAYFEVYRNESQHICQHCVL